MTKKVKPSYKELEDLLAEAEQMIRAILSGEVDAFISEKGIYLMRLKEIEEELRRSRNELQQQVNQRTVELEATNRRLKKLNAELQDFTYIASHDLQEPLRKIQNFGGLLIDLYGGSLDETGRDYLERMMSAVTRMRNLIDSLLAYSLTTQAGPYKQVDLNKSVKQAVSNLEMLINEKQARLEVSDLPLIEADQVQMIQLFQNLIANALKFQPAGSCPCVKIESRLDTAGQTCEIRVTDNGIGFEKKYLDRIFLPFQRLHDRDSGYQGVGMGLPICRKIVEHGGGTITARSRPNQGSTFIVTLPLKCHQSPESPDSP